MKNELGLLPRDQHASENTRACGHLQPHAPLGTSVVGGVAVQQGVLVATQRHLSLATVGVGHLHLELAARAVQDAADGAVADVLATAVAHHLFHLGDDEVVPAGGLELVEQVDRGGPSLPDDTHPLADFATIIELGDDRCSFVEQPQGRNGLRVPS